MILRKPYAFLIKHFRMIHFVILLLMGYVFYKTISIITFLNSRVSGKAYSDYSMLANKHVNFLLILALILLVGGVISILYLLQHKEKPFRFYVITLTQYGLGIILFLVLKSYIGKMSYTALNATTVRLARDITIIYGVSQVPAMIFAFVRAIGFDIKKFDFRRDIADLEISSADDEEFAFDIDIDAQDINTRLRKRLRYLKYYYLENRTVFYMIYAIIGVLFLISLVGLFAGKDKVYKEGDTFNIFNIQMTVMDSYKTFYSTTGSKISDKSFFVITKVKMKNVGNQSTTFNTRLLYLSYTDTASSQISPKYAKHFQEFGSIYNDNVIARGEERIFIFVFEVPKEYYENKIQFKILTNVDYKDKKGYNFHYCYVKLNPGEDEEENKVITTKKIGEELSFEGSYLGNTKLLIEDYKINDSFQYNVYQCQDSKCSEKVYFLNSPTDSSFDLSLMRIKYKISYDRNKFDSYYNVNDFVAKFANLKYVINGKEYDNRVILKDDSPYDSNNYSFIEVRSKAKGAEKVFLRFNIRNKIFDYVLYEK